MIPLAGCKQEQCVADTSRTQQESEREHRLKFAPHITSELHFSSIKTNFYQHNEIVFVTGEVLLSLCNVPVTQKCPANTLLMCSGRILSGSFHTGGNLKICWEFKVLKSKRGMYLLKTLQEKGVSWRGGVQGARQRQELYETEKTLQECRWENKQATGCQALAQPRYFPLCAQLDSWDGEQYSPLLSQTLTQEGEFNCSMLGCYRNSFG